MKYKQKGFTLIEIIVVMVIVGILGVTVVPQLMGKVDQARITKAKNDIVELESALMMYRLDKSKFPDTDEGLNALKGNYIKKLQKDPWNRDYIYISPGTHGENGNSDFDLYSYGADGIEGGEGEDQDIGNWEESEVVAESK